MLRATPVRDGRMFQGVGTVQLILALGVLVSTTFLMVKGFDVKMWGCAIFGLGLISVAARLLIAAEGTFAVIFLAIPWVLVVLAGSQQG